MAQTKNEKTKKICKFDKSQQNWQNTVSQYKTEKSVQNWEVSTKLRSQYKTEKSVQNWEKSVQNSKKYVHTNWKSRYRNNLYIQICFPLLWKGEATKWPDCFKSLRLGKWINIPHWVTLVRSRILMTDNTHIRLIAANWAVG